VPSCRAASATRYGQDDPDSDGLADVRKTKLVNLHRADLVQTLRPSDDDVRSFHQENKNKLAFREKRRVQTIVLPTREQAFFVKSEIENDTASDPWATRPRSATERVDSALHDLGWVVRGSGYPPLDRVIFQLEPGVVGGPVASPAGWHLVRVTEVRDGIVGSIEEASSRETVRRLLTERRLHEYVLELRKRRFPVVVYEDQLRELFREETRWGVA
jgi:peptidyl-prolyl cis-trans isomerase D